MIKKIDRSIIVEKFDVPKEIKNTEPKMENKSVNISVSDVVDMLAGYQIAIQPVVKTSPENNTGKCMICGKGTNAPERKICWECHKVHMKNIYQQCVQTMKDGKTQFEYKY